MAGTIVADQLQDGAGNSTSMDNAIYGSAKAWVNFNGTTATIRASYNVSSITRASTGNYTVNMTNALTDANYAPVISTGDGPQVNNINVNYNNSGTLTAPTTTAFIFSTTLIGTGVRDQTYINVAVFR
jgi:carbamate kinase